MKELLKQTNNFGESHLGARTEKKEIHGCFFLSGFICKQNQ